MKRGRHSPLAIAIVTEFYYPLFGAVAEHVHGLANELALRGHRVVVITGAPRYVPSPLTEPPTPCRYELIRVGTSRLVHANGAAVRLTSGASLGRTLRAIFDERAVDIVHVHPGHQPVLPWAAIAAAPAAVVATEHTDFRPRWLAGLARPIVRGWLGKVDELLFVSPVARENISRAFGTTRGHVVPSGVDLAWLSTPRARPSMLEKDRPHALWVGRFDTKSGIDTAIEAVRLAAQRIAGLRLVVIADCSDGGASIGRLRARGVDILVVGARNGDRPAFYQACEATLVTARISSFGRTLVEAMAAGSPLVASDLPASRFIVGDDATAALVAVDDAPAFAGELIDLLRNRTTWTRRVERARKRATAFGWSRIAARVEAVYGHALARAEA